jgi:hypothetical protein
MRKRGDAVVWIQQNLMRAKLVQIAEQEAEHSPAKTVFGKRELGAAV